MDDSAESPTPPRLGKAPILEALFFVQVPELPSDALPTLRAVAEELANGGVVTAQHKFEAKLDFEGLDYRLQDRSDPYGFRAFSPDGKQVCQLRLDGFGFSQLAPYEAWTPFRTAAASN